MLWDTAGSECVVVMGRPSSDTSSIFCTSPWGDKAQRFMPLPMAPRLNSAFPSHTSEMVLKLWADLIFSNLASHKLIKADLCFGHLIKFLSPTSLFCLKSEVPKLIYLVEDETVAMHSQSWIIISLTGFWPCNTDNLKCSSLKTNFQIQIFPDCDFWGLLSLICSEMR